MTQQQDDRRLYRREPTRLPSKLFRVGTLKFSGGETVNVSAGGALLMVRSTQSLQVGEPVEVGVCWERESVMARETMAAGEIVRVNQVAPGQQMIAVRYIDPAIVQLANRLDGIAA